jgi:hypothetical protein
VRQTLAVDFAYASAGKSLIDKLDCLDGAGIFRVRALVAWLGKRLVKVSAPVCNHAPEVIGQKLTLTLTLTLLFWELAPGGAAPKILSVI